MTDRRTNRDLGLSGFPFAAATAWVFLLLPTLMAAQSRQWRAEDRAVLGDFRHVTAVAATSAGVFAVTTGGILVYDTRFDRWLPPVTALEGWTPGVPVTAIGDPADESLWIAYEDRVVHYTPVIRLFETVMIPGRVRALAFDRADPFRGLYVQTTREWLLVPRGAPATTPAFDVPPETQRIVPMSVAEFLDRYPAADALDIVATRARGRRHPYTAVAADPVSRFVFVGTDGLGLLRYDPGAARFERLPFGLLSAPVGALTSWEDGVWVGGDAAGEEVGIVWVGDELQRWREAVGPPGFVSRWSTLHDLVVWQDATWAATDRGLLRIANGSLEMQGRSVGLPFTHVTALAGSADALWVGTTRGLAVRSRLGRFDVVGDELDIGVVASLARTGDTLWVAGSRGLSIVAPDRAIERAARIYRQPLLQEPLVSVARGGDILVVATEERIGWRQGAARWVVGRPLVELEAIQVVEVDSRRGVWIGGRLGVVYFDADTGAFRHVLVGGDLPGPVRDIVATDRYLWVGTEAGLVRVRRDEIR